jgi:hypothetical protein
LAVQESLSVSRRKGLVGVAGELALKALKQREVRRDAFLLVYRAMNNRGMVHMNVAKRGEHMHHVSQSYTLVFVVLSGINFVHVYNLI